MDEDVPGVAPEVQPPPTRSPSSSMLDSLMGRGAHASPAGSPTGPAAPGPSSTAPQSPAATTPGLAPSPAATTPGLAPSPAATTPGLAPSPAGPPGPMPPAPSAHVHGSSGPTPPAPVRQAVPELAPDTHGADVGLVPDAPGAVPAPQIRVSEAETQAYSRGSTEEKVRDDDFSLASALFQLIEMRGSDLHLTGGAPPTVRVDGSLRPIPDTEELEPDVIQRVMYAILTQQQRERFEETLELDFSYALPDVARFRVNLYRQRGALGAAFRIIPYEIKTIEQLGMPPALSNFASLPRGFVLVTGPTGSGKSTTLAALVDLANRTRNDHIMTVEDPIEFLHEHKSCLVNQREVGEDTYTFANALKHVLRQDPDIILVGEMRDLETIQVALTAAETGHLVFATLHTQDAAQTIDRVIDVFPPSQQQQIRQQLAGTLQGIVCQTLCKTTDGRGRVAGTEVLVATPAIRNLIREGKTHQIYSALQAGAGHGMHTLDQHLAELVRKGRITYDVGLEKCHHVEDYTRLAGKR